MESFKLAPRSHAPVPDRAVPHTRPAAPYIRQPSSETLRSNAPLKSLPPAIPPALSFKQSGDSISRSPRGSPSLLGDFPASPPSHLPMADEYTLPVPLSRSPNPSPGSRPLPLPPDTPPTHTRGLSSPSHGSLPLPDRPALSPPARLHQRFLSTDNLATQPEEHENNTLQLRQHQHNLSSENVIPSRSEPIMLFPGPVPAVGYMNASSETLRLAGTSCPQSPPGVYARPS